MSTDIEVTDNLIDTLKEAGKAQIVATTDGREFSTEKLYPMPQATVQEEPLPAALRLNTLAGVVDYLKSYNETAGGDDEPVDILIQVCNEQHVRLISGIFGPAKQREVYVEALCPSPSFRFGLYYAVEEFIIAIKTLFVQTSAIEQITAIVGNIVDGKVKTTSDDGVTQTVEVKQGIRRAEVDIANPYVLQPFRTFREITEQPESPFILRLKGGDTPQCALFEADGGLWKLEAINRIQEFFQAAQVGVPIIC